jgi:nucleoside-triphosphatase THEP1
MKNRDSILLDEISVHVVGHSGTGKTTIQIIIADALRANGFNVDVETNPDFRDETELRKRYDMYSEDRCDAIRSRIKKITVHETQAKRIPYKWSR